MNSLQIRFMGLVIKLLLALQKDNLHPEIIGQCNDFLIDVERYLPFGRE